MKKVIKSRIFLVIITLIIGTSLGVYAAGTYKATDIVYNSSDGTSMNVSEVLNELYNKTCLKESVVYNFDHTGNEQVFTVPATGTYQLEVWGAQGGSYDDNYSGGYGGYSQGKISLKKGEILYINVGGQGDTSKSKNPVVPGGYNGGGSAYVMISSCSNFSGSGGGATHISTKSGLLSTLSSSINDILIVSGGGGGSSYRNCSASDAHFSSGGPGGGYIGSNYLNLRTTLSSKLPTGGTQSSGGTGGTINNEYGYLSGSFGQGATSDRTGGFTSTSGGGSGFYGGGSGMFIGSAGGSGYIGNALLTEKSMYCYNCTTSNEEQTKTISITCTNSTPTEKCTKQGNGYAKITYLGK